MRRPEQKFLLLVVVSVVCWMLAVPVMRQ